MNFKTTHFRQRTILLYIYLALVKGILHNKIYWFSSGLKFNIREKSNENLKFHQKI